MDLKGSLTGTFVIYLITVGVYFFFLGGDDAYTVCKLEKALFGGSTSECFIRVFSLGWF